MLTLIKSPTRPEQHEQPITTQQPAKRRPRKSRLRSVEDESGFHLECGIAGEQALWRAVITQALMDAGNQSTKRELRFHRGQAIAWFSRRNPDFITVCTLAGLDVDYVFHKATQAIREGCTWRQTPNEKQKNRR